MIRITLALLLVACGPKPVDTTGPSSSPPTHDGTALPPPNDEPATGACTKEECGPAMGMPNSTCPDGKTIAGPMCRRDDDGKCGYVVVECPP